MKPNGRPAKAGQIIPSSASVAWRSRPTELVNQEGLALVADIAQSAHAVGVGLTGQSGRPAAITWVLDAHDHDFESFPVARAY